MPSAPLTSADPAATAVLTIDLRALRSNYRTLQKRAGGAECAAVIKANAYGTGAERAIVALAAEGCRTFFVASFTEAQTVRATQPGATIYVLDGFFPGSGPQFADTGIRPVLCSLADVTDWSAFCRETGQPLAAAVQIDTGMNRLGLPREEVEQLSHKHELLEHFTPTLVMSHLACADAPDHPMNARQRDLFDELRAMLPPGPASLANSAGIFLGPDYHYNLVRAGFALYGGRAASGQNPLEPVVQLHGRISQVHDAKPGDGVGYGAAQILGRDTRIATVSLGYADGIFRRLGGGDGDGGLTGYIDGRPAPVVGRISMDLITLDVTGMPEELARRGGWVEFIGPHAAIDDLAEAAGTIGYEVLTSLSARAQRIYHEAETGAS